MFMKAMLRLAIFTLAFGVGLTRVSTVALAQDFAGQFPISKQTKYFDFHSKRNSSQVTGTIRFADGFIKIVNRDFFKADFDYPMRVFVLEDQNQFEEFVHRELHMPGPAGFGIYMYSNKVLATYEDSGLGTFTHEVLHPLLQRNLRLTPRWAVEGIPTFFEKFYGYWKGDELVLFWGFQNPWRIEELGANLAQLNLREIISGQESNESKLRMVSLFLWEQGRFRRFLKLIAANDKQGYASYFEGAMEMPLEKILPLWQQYLRDVAQQRARILSLPLSTVFDSEATFQSFAKLHGISTKQVQQRD